VFATLLAFEQKLPLRGIPVRPNAAALEFLVGLFALPWASHIDQSGFTTQTSDKASWRTERLRVSPIADSARLQLSSFITAHKSLCAPLALPDGDRGPPPARCPRMRERRRDVVGGGFQGGRKSAGHRRPPWRQRNAACPSPGGRDKHAKGGTTQVASPKDLAERSVPLLSPGSQVRQAFLCQTAPNFAFFFINWATGLTMFWIKYRCVAVTRDAIYVLDSYRLSGGAKPTSIIGTLPRHTQLGPMSGRWGQLTLLEKRHWVKRRFHAEITAADAEAGFTYRS
jgi:hypothetical protein